MAYEHTEVPVDRSQAALRKLIQAHKGFGLAVISEQDPQGREASVEGFQAKVMIDQTPCVVKIMAKVRRVGNREQEERRIWRVLYYHMKGIFEAADSGVMEFRTMMLPYIVTPNGMTVAEQIMPRLQLVLTGKMPKLLTEGS